MKLTGFGLDVINPSCRETRGKSHGIYMVQASNIKTFEVNPDTQIGGGGLEINGKKYKYFNMQKPNSSEGGAVAKAMLQVNVMASLFQLPTVAIHIP